MLCLSGMGVDLFFDIPTDTNPRRFIYQTVNVPIEESVLPPRLGSIPKHTFSCDWLGQMTTFLQQGWRLVEIFLDMSSAPRDQSLEATVNSVWFFEKEASRVNDPSPVYEGTVIEYEHKLSAGLTSISAPPQWESLLCEMGKRGWELACILETPDIRITGLQQSKMKLLMFFQRKLSGMS